MKIYQLVRKFHVEGHIKLDFARPILSLQIRKIGYEDVKKNKYIRKGTCMNKTKKYERGNKNRCTKTEGKRIERREGRRTL
jgi:hypothetical protein